MSAVNEVDRLRRELQQARGLCTYGQCPNTARCINQYGWLCCHLCPHIAGHDAIRISDVPQLLEVARVFVRSKSPAIDAMKSAFSVLLGVDPRLAKPAKRGRPRRRVLPTDGGRR